MENWELVCFIWDKEMDFVDPASLTQRHCLEDSDEEDESLTTQSTDAGSFIIPEDTAKLPPGSNLIITIGQAASIFAQSYLSITPLPFCTISTDCQTVFKDKHFSSSSTAQFVVSEGFAVQGYKQFYLCTHQRELNSQLCNSWCDKVSVSLMLSEQCSGGWLENEFFKELRISLHAA